MNASSMRRPSPALLIAIIALVAALAGTAGALPGKNSVKSNDIKKNAIKGKHVKNDKLKGADVDEASLGQVPSANSANSANSAASLVGHKRKGLTRVVATEGATEDAARAAAPELTLFTAGPLTVYGKCFTDASVPRTYARAYVKTSQDGSVLDSENDILKGNPFLDSTTDEEDREARTASAGANNAEADFIDSNEIGAWAPDGTAIEARVQIAVKNGNVTGGNGLYGDGNICFFAGDMTQFIG